MGTDDELIEQTRNLLPDLAELAEYLASHPKAIIPERLRPAYVGRDIVTETQEEPSKLVEALVQQGQILEAAGQSAVIKVRDHGSRAVLTADERIAYQLIVQRIGRPALLVMDGDFVDEPVGWEILGEHRAEIRHMLRSVGRIELEGHPQLTWAGTGFLVADDVIMTNHHVASSFAAEQPGSGWKFKFVDRVSIDYIQEIGATTSANFTITEVIGTHPTLDLALLRVKQTGGSEPPTPLTLARDFPVASEQATVYLIGYPGPPPPNRDQFLARSIFADTYGVKRLQPGKIKEIDQSRPLFTHDCSTLGGNSGSPIIDLESGLVIGLHYAGTYLVANHAVALWQLAGDPLLKAAKVNFD